MQPNTISIDGLLKKISSQTSLQLADINTPPGIKEQVNDWNTKVIRIDDSSLGRYTFMPVYINGYELPNAIIQISGEKRIIETDLVDIGTVFENTGQMPYKISILIQLIGANKLSPVRHGGEFRPIVDLWKGNELVTIKCALVDYFMDQSYWRDNKKKNGKIEFVNNFLITKIEVLDNAGSECTETIRIDGETNFPYLLEIIDKNPR